MITDLINHFRITTNEESDGILVITVSYDKTFKKGMREMYNRKKCTKKLVQGFFNNVIRRIEEECQQLEWDSEGNNENFTSN